MIIHILTSSFVFSPQIVTIISSFYIRKFKHFTSFLDLAGLSPTPSKKKKLKTDFLEMRLICLLFFINVVVGNSLYRTSSHNPEDSLQFPSDRDEADKSPRSGALHSLVTE